MHFDERPFYRENKCMQEKRQEFIQGKRFERLVNPTRGAKGVTASLG